jgi:hypothetical protein
MFPFGAILKLRPLAASTFCNKKKNRSGWLSRFQSLQSQNEISYIFSVDLAQYELKQNKDLPVEIGRRLFRGVSAILARAAAV